MPKPCPRCNALELVAEENDSYRCAACERRYRVGASGDLEELDVPPQGPAPASSVWGSIAGAFRSFVKSVGGQT